MSRADRQPRLMGDDGGRYAQVIVDQPGRGLDQEFTYTIPAHLEPQVRVGSYVQVPFGRRRLPGFAVGFTTQRPDFRLKDIDALLLDEPLFDERGMELARWLAGHYLCPLRDALRCLLPPGAGRGAETMVEPTQAGLSPPGELARAPRQQQALAALVSDEWPVSMEALAARVAQSDPGASAAMVRSAVSALAERGLVNVRRSLRRPQVQTLARLVARLAVDEDACRDAMQQIERRAPKQVETLQALLDAGNEGLPVADLNRAAVRALADKGLVAVSEEETIRRPEAMGIGGESETFLDLTEA
ncbi:MAG TPA: hypothetical protein VM283_02250, partial [Armatimonadota bacterium]|nr:hypothetical protein [Armatimonadota bacterium]